MTRSTALYQLLLFFVHIRESFLVYSGWIRSPRRPYYTGFISVFASSDCVTYDVCFQGPNYANYCPANNHTRQPQALGPADSLVQQELAQKCPHLFAGSYLSPFPICLLFEPEENVLFSRRKRQTVLFGITDKVFVRRDGDAHPDLPTVPGLPRQLLEELVRVYVFP